MRRGPSGGWSLVEHLVAMSLVGGLLLSVLPLAVHVVRESAEASDHADGLAMRWETVRRFRRDVSRAASARSLRSTGGAATGIVLVDDWGSVTWAEHEGLLHRAAAPGPVVQGAALRARFAVETVQGRTFVSYVFEDDAGELSGRALVGSAP
jgi:type II secretory pathway pseudopilin PulG